MPVRKTIEEGRVPVRVWTDDVEAEALKQLVNISRLPIVHHHVAAMPDVHLGIGATVGSVIPTRKAIIPAAVGVDIGCGMGAVRLSLTANDLDDLPRPRASTRSAATCRWASTARCARCAGHAAKPFAHVLDRIADKHPELAKMQKHFDETWVHQLGTLGGGNHFIEVCLDEDDRVWVMLHSGQPRHRQRDRPLLHRAGAESDAEATHVRLPDRDLAYFPEGAELFDDYVEAVGWAQDYARANRARDDGARPRGAAARTCRRSR